MEKFRYGPLVYVTHGMNDDEGNYFWNGSSPVGYDEMGVPIDQNGMQCLDISCPIHPSWEPNETVYNVTLNSKIPSVEYFRQWFDDNFLIISDDQIKRYIIRWWSSHSMRHNYSAYRQVLHNYSSVEEIMEAAWPDATTS